MAKPGCIKLSAALISICIIFLLSTGFSYLDPGTGSLLVQIAIAGIVAAAATLGKFRRKITGIFKGSGKRNKSKLDEKRNKYESDEKGDLKD